MNGEPYLEDCAKGMEMILMQNLKVEFKEEHLFKKACLKRSLNIFPHGVRMGVRQTFKCLSRLYLRNCKV